MIREPSGSSTSATRLPSAGARGLHLHLDDLELIAGEIEEPHDPMSRQRVLDEVEDHVGRGHGRLDAEQL